MNEKEKEILVECPYCGSDEYIKKGYNRTGEKRRYLCKECGKYYAKDIINNNISNKTKENKIENKENIKNKFSKVTVKINGFLKSAINDKEKEETIKATTVVEKDEKRGFRFIYLHGPNVEAFKRLANDLDLIIELKDSASNLYKITNPHYSTKNKKN